MFCVKEGTVEIPAETVVLKAKDYGAKLSAENTIKLAEKKAAQIIEEAKAVYASEKQRGYDEGLQAGNEKIAEMMMDNVTKSLKNFEEFENDMVNIVIQALRKIIGDMDKRELIKSVVHSAMEQVRNQKRVNVIVNPSELEYVKGMLEDILKTFPLVSFLNVESDPRVSSGGCKLETDVGVVDASIETQINSIKRSLEKAVK